MTLANIIAYLTFTQLSQKLGGRSRSSIYRDVEAERLPPPVRIGGRVYFIEHEVDDAIAVLNDRSDPSSAVRQTPLRAGHAHGGRK